MMGIGYNQSIKAVNTESSLTLKYLGSNFKHMNFGERLKAARDRVGLTQQELAEKSGVRQVTISKIERGESESSTFTVKLATACGVRPEWLDSEQGEMVDGLYVEGDKLRHLFKIAQELPEYALDDAIKRVTDLSQLLQQAGVASGQDRRRHNPLPESEQEAVYGRRKTDRNAQ